MISKAFVIWKLRHVSELKGWKGTIIRTYFVRGGRLLYRLLREPIPKSDGLFKELQTILDTPDREMAKSVCRAYRAEDPQGVYCYQSGPVDALLPTDTCQYGEQGVGDDKVDTQYDHRDLDFYAIPRDAAHAISRHASSLAQAPRVL